MSTGWQFAHNMNRKRIADVHAMTEMPTIRVVDVHKRFGALEVLKGVSFDVHRGNVVSMIGASGSGKSSMRTGPSRFICASRLKYEGASGRSVVIIFIKDSRGIG